MLFLAMLALLAGISSARADNFTISQLDDIESLPCSIFQGDGLVSLREGVTLTVPLSATNNSELFAQLGERSGRCRAGIANAPALADAAE
jgi:hypothetical protein